MLHLLQQGGWVMYPILACSILALAIILERSIYFLWTKENYEKILKNLKKELNSSQNIEKAQAFLKNRRATSLNRVASVYFAMFKKRKEVFENILHRIGSQELNKLERRLPVLAVIGHLTPLMGLLGTILGMITCFRKMAAIGGQANITVLAEGIWVALLTTAFGLIVAIPVMAAYHFFEYLVNKRSDQLQYLISELNQLFNVTPTEKKINNEGSVPLDEENYETIH